MNNNTIVCSFFEVKKNKIFHFNVTTSNAFPINMHTFLTMLSHYENINAEKIFNPKQFLLSDIALKHIFPFQCKTDLELYGI